MDYEIVLAQLVEWAGADERVRALVLTGSGAAGSAHPLSDRDVEVFSSDVDLTVADESWWAELGDVLVVERLEDDLGNPTRLVYYVGGKIDFTILSASSAEGRRYDRPFEVLFDDDAIADRFLRVSLEWSRPSAEQLTESMNWAYAAALMCAKAIARNEPWSAKLRDNDLKEQLLEMIEWDHRSRYGVDFDTRYLATRMNQWMDSDVKEALSQCWGHFDPRDSARALRATLDLYAAVAIRTTNALGSYANVDHRRIRHDVESILGGV